MKIAHLISNYFPNIGGAQMCIHQLANRTVERGDQAVVITPTPNGGNRDNFKYEILRLNPILNKFLFVNFQLGKLYVKYILNQIQKKYNFDLWQVTIGYPLGAASVDFFNRSKIPCILRCTGEDIQMFPELGYGYRLDKKVDKIVAENYKKFTALIIAGDGTKKEYLSLNVPEDKIFIIPNGVDCKKFRMHSDSKNVRRELGITENQKVILTVGRVHPKKGYKYIPLIIKRLLKKCADFKWLLVGKGAEGIKSLAEKEGVGEYLITKEAGPGFSDRGEPEIPNNRLIQYYKAADIFVFPTMIELFAKSIIEAMASGLPIVTTDAQGVNDIIRNGENGLKCKVGDAEGMADLIIRLFFDDGLARDMSENALSSARNYDWGKVTDSYFDLYERLINRFHLR